MIADNMEKIDNIARKGRSAMEEVRLALEAMILSGGLQPGDRLNELALASRFEVNRGILREAVRALEEARLVEVIANRGAYVRKLDLGEALELFDVRAGFARSAGRLAVQRATRAQIGELQQLHDRVGAAVKIGNIAQFHELNLRFHNLLIHIAANRRLHEMDLAVRNEMQLYLRNNVQSDAQLKVSHQEHGQIVSALSEGDADSCARAFELHILNGKKRLLDSAGHSFHRPEA
jgi:DNA-binding GntR family transcriptional regulator